MCTNRRNDPPLVYTIDFINIDTPGNSQDFGDISESTQKHGGACGNRTRGLYAGGRYPSNSNVISFITFASQGNTQNFGDLVAARRAVSAGANATRAIFFGGNDGSNSDNYIQFVTIASTGNTTDFGWNHSLPPSNVSNAFPGFPVFISDVPINTASYPKSETYWRSSQEWIPLSATFMDRSGSKGNIFSK